MPDWTKSMQQYFEFYTVDPSTWGNDKLIGTVESASISRDLYSDTLGTAAFSIYGTPGEKYIRTYMITNQNGVKEKFVLGTHLVQSPSYTFDGARQNTQIDAYTPLIELREKYPPIGYTVLKGTDIPTEVIRLVTTLTRVPVVDKYARYTNPNAEVKLYENFTADPNDTWFSFLSKLLAKSEFRFDLDDYGKICLAPIEKLDSLHPIWTYTSDNSSILYNGITVDKDIFGIPNVIEVYKGTRQAIVKNTNAASPVSIQNRGREIVYREINPNINGLNEQQALDDYAAKLLKSLSKVSYTINYSHGYAPVKIGEGVILDCPKAGLTNVRAMVVAQTINCRAGCQVTEKAVFTESLLEVDDGA